MKYLLSSILVLLALSGCTKEVKQPDKGYLYSEKLCEHFGGFKETTGYDFTSAYSYTHERLEVRCNDGSTITRTWWLFTK